MNIFNGAAFAHGSCAAGWNQQGAESSAVRVAPLYLLRKWRKKKKISKGNATLRLGRDSQKYFHGPSSSPLSRLFTANFTLTSHFSSRRWRQTARLPKFRVQALAWRGARPRGRRAFPKKAGGGGTQRDKNNNRYFQMDQNNILLLSKVTRQVWITSSDRRSII